MTIQIKYIFILCMCAISPYLWANNAAPWVGKSFDGLPCPNIPTGFGPFDYTKPRITKTEKSNLYLVESTHFTHEIEYLIKGKSGSLNQELGYTIRAWPNHPRALLSIVRYQIKLNNKMLRKNIPMEAPIECFFYRAMNFSPKDPAVHTIFAYYLKKIGKLKEAEKHYLKALKITPNNSKIEYSYALLLIKLKRLNEALEYAKKAYQHATPPKKLKEKLIKLGVWK